MIGIDMAESVLLQHRGAVMLRNEEQEEARLIKAESRRRRFIQTRTALRALLSDACDNTVHESEWRFTRLPGGKPCLECKGGFPSFEFSISHARTFSAIAVTSGEPIGIDIESASTSRSAIIPSPVALCPEECGALATAPESERWRRFIRIWTAKEAYAKFLGVGIDLDFTGIRVDLACNRVACRHAKNRAMPVGALVAEYFILDKKAYMVSHVIAENARSRPRVYLLRHSQSNTRASIIAMQGGRYY
jgi:phosphopantetheinyl transferase